MDAAQFTAKERKQARKALLKKIDDYNKQARKSRSSSFLMTSPSKVLQLQLRVISRDFLPPHVIAYPMSGFIVDGDMKSVQSDFESSMFLVLTVEIPSTAGSGIQRNS